MFFVCATYEYFWKNWKFKKYLTIPCHTHLLKMTNQKHLTKCLNCPIDEINLSFSHFLSKTFKMFSFYLLFWTKFYLVRLNWRFKRTTNWAITIFNWILEKANLSIETIFELIILFTTVAGYVLLEKMNKKYIFLF